MSDLFSDREHIRRAPVTTEISDRTWYAVIALIERRLHDGTLGYRFPLLCPDQPICIGTDVDSFNAYVEAHVPGVYTVIRRDNGAPPTAGVLDLLELVGESVGRPIARDVHNYFGHTHLAHDRDAGLAEFIEEVNRLFRRAGVQFEMDETGRFRRLGPPLLRPLVQRSAFATGDDTLDALLGEACTRIMSRDARDNRMALERLWDAFERTKGLEPGANKPAQIAALLDRAADGTGPGFHAALEAEATALNRIGNDFQIRHHDHRAEGLTRPEQIDALFFRMFSFLHYVLAATGRVR
ncbi:MAG: hypothetical protein KGJ78_16615 [Alphaproteobacteria bacterium]|nr:hypothetical protein [Alphaproteobacteria bacterium]